MSTRQLVAVLAALTVGLGAFAWAQPEVRATSQDADGGVDQVQEAQDQPARRRIVRLVRPWSDLQDLTPRQQAEIREIRAEILDRRDELDREERQRIMAVLTDFQRQRVLEIEAERERLARERAEQARESRRNRNGGDEGEGDDGQ